MALISRVLTRLFPPTPACDPAPMAVALQFQAVLAHIHAGRSTARDLVEARFGEVLVRSAARADLIYEGSLSSWDDDALHLTHKGEATLKLLTGPRRTRWL